MYRITLLKFLFILIKREVNSENCMVVLGICLKFNPPPSPKKAV